MKKEDSPLWSSVKEYSQLHRELINEVIPRVSLELKKWEKTFDIPVSITEGELTMLYNRTLAAIQDLNHIAMNIDRIQSRQDQIDAEN